MDRTGLAFKLFPEEIWEQILDNLDTSTDVLNAYKAYPELERERVLKTKTHLWLFEQVIPHISEWITGKEILFLRQVCSKWCRGVDNFLENHPLLRAYDHDNQVVGQNWTHVCRNVACPHNHNYHYSAGWYRLPNPKRFTDFPKDMEDHPPERNPIVGRLLNMSMCVLREPREELAFLNFLRKFGKHVWFLALYNHHADHDRFNQLALDALSLVPNLKGLTIGCKRGAPYVEADEFAAFEELLQGRHAPLPKLDQLEWVEQRAKECGLVVPLVTFLLKGHSTQMRRLLIPHSNWDWGFDELFPQLTELHLDNIPSKEELVDFMGALHAPKLWKLSLRCSMPYLQEVIPLLQRFPRIQHLVAWYQILKLRKPTSGIPDSLLPVPSLKSLVLDYGGSEELELDILRYFPSLEYLQLSWKTKVLPECCQGDNIHQSGIWGLLPKLKTIVIALDGLAQKKQRNCFIYSRR